jgi:hypothetical protein
MWEPTPQNIENLRTNNLFKIFSFTKKNELTKYAAGITVTGTELFETIVGCQHLGYLYFRQQDIFAPDHLLPKDEEIKSFGNRASENTDKLKLQGKFFKKVIQSFKERKMLILHLFTFSSSEWHVIYFNEKDSDIVDNNHWENGPHIHFINYLWGNINLENLWNNFPKLPNNGLHIRYKD